jgi:hypothetical protein
VSAIAVDRSPSGLDIPAGGLSGGKETAGRDR